MTIRKALKDLTALKTEILKDGIIDLNETTKLLDFIEPYVQSNNRIFADFKATVCACRKDGKISMLESAKLETEIDNMLYFLKVEMIVEYVLGGILLLSLIAAGIYYGVVT